MESTKQAKATVFGKVRTLKAAYTAATQHSSVQAAGAHGVQRRQEGDATDDKKIMGEVGKHLDEASNTLVAANLDNYTNEEQALLSQMLHAV